MKLALVICILISIMSILIYTIRKEDRSRTLLGIIAVSLLISALIINIL